MRFGMLKQIVAVMGIVALMAANTPVMAAGSTETPEKTYTGNSEAAVQLAGMRFSDPRLPGLWARDVVYQSAALGFLQGYGANRFGVGDVLTKEQAVAFAYKLAGRETEAKTAADALDAARSAADKKLSPDLYWADGYFQIAANDGTISATDLADALNIDQTSVAPEGFHRESGATREDMAFYIAKAMKLAPVYANDYLFSSFADWRQASPSRLPYLEAVVSRRIMNGDNTGRFLPLSGILREEAAQMAVNARTEVFRTRGWAALSGTVEDAVLRTLYDGTTATEKGVYRIRNTDGKIHSLETAWILPQGTQSHQERSGGSVLSGDKEFIVLKNGQVGASSLLSTGDKIEYIVDGNNVVRFIRVTGQDEGEHYYISKFVSTDATGGITVSPFVEVPSKDTAVARSYSAWVGDGDRNQVRYPMAGSFYVLDPAGTPVGVSSLKAGDLFVLTEKNGIAQDARIFILSKDKRQGIVSGIVEENEPSLGYIRLYDPAGHDGSGGQTYTYTSGDLNSVVRNGAPAQISDIRPGDTAFLEIAEDGTVRAVSSKDNLVLYQGRVTSNKNGRMTVKLSDGKVRQFDKAEGTQVLRDGTESAFAAIIPGDAVRIFTRETPQFTEVSRVDATREPLAVAGVYKAELAYVDKTSDKIVVSRIYQLDHNAWQPQTDAGFRALRSVSGADIRDSAGNAMSLTQLSKVSQGTPVYFVTVRQNGSEELLGALRTVAAGDAESPMAKDTASEVSLASGRLTMQNSGIAYNLGNQTLIIKNGQLIAPAGLDKGDSAWVVPVRQAGANALDAKIVNVAPAAAPALTIVRGRIKAVVQNASVTLESYSQLNDGIWNYANTPRTTTLDMNTQLITAKGIDNISTLVPWGTDTAVGKTVYVVEKDGKALQISYGTFGPYQLKGDVRAVQGIKLGSDGKVLTEPTTYTLTGNRLYDTTSHTFTGVADADITITGATILIRNGQLIQPSEIRKGDHLSVMKKDNAAAGEAAIVIVEE